jgi:hypothetical protein
MHFDKNCGNVSQFSCLCEKLSTKSVFLPVTYNYMLVFCSNSCKNLSKLDAITAHLNDLTYDNHHKSRI